MIDYLYYFVLVWKSAHSSWFNITKNYQHHNYNNIRCIGCDISTCTMTLITSEKILNKKTTDDLFFFYYYLSTFEKNELKDPIRTKVTPIKKYDKKLKWLKF